MRRIAASLLAILLLASPGAFAEEGAYESPPAARLSDVIDPAEATAAGARVAEPLEPDDYLLRFRFSSEFGEYDVLSRALFRQRLHELATMRRLSEMSGSDEFVRGAMDRAKSLPGTVEKLVTDPKATAEAVGQGVGKTLGRVGGLFGGRSKSAYEGNAVESALVGDAKRKLAAELNVDVYSGNARLQSLLDEIAGARAAGKFSVGLASYAVPGSVAMGLTGVSTITDLRATLRDLSPGDLAKRNEASLRRLGVPDYAARPFLSHRWLSPRHQTVIVTALERMQGVARPEAVIVAANEAQDEARALLHERQALLLAWYHANRERLAAMDAVGAVVVARTASGPVVACLPVDQVAWTPATAAAAEGIRGLPSVAAAPSRTLLLTGRATPLAKERLEKAGFVVEDGVKPQADLRSADAGRR